MISLETYINFCYYVNLIKEHIELDSILHYLDESSTGTYEDQVKLVLYLADDIEKQLEKDKNKESFVYVDLFKKFKNITCKKLEVIFDDSTFSDVHTKADFDKESGMFEITQIHLNKRNYKLKNFSNILVLELAHELLHDFQDLQTYKKNNNKHFIDKINKTKYIKISNPNFEEYLDLMCKRIEYISTNIEKAAFVSEIETIIEYNINKFGCKDTLKNLEKILKNTALKELADYKENFDNYIYNVDTELNDLQILFCKYATKYNATYKNHDYKYIMNAYSKKINRTLNTFMKKLKTIVQTKLHNQAIKEHKIF